MNNVDISLLAQDRETKKKSYGLDEEGIANFRSKIEIVSKEEREGLGKGMLECISKKGFGDDVDKVIEYIQRGANIEYKNETKGDFALLVCARKGYFKTFLALLKAGANIDQTNNYQTTVAMAAARHGRKDMLELLIILGANINAHCKDGDDALISAKRHDQVECFNMLVENNVHLYHQNIDQEGAIDISSSKDFDFSKFTLSPKVVAKIGASDEEARDLILEAEEALKKVLNKK